MSAKKVVLYIRVFRGGDLWRECYAYNKQFFELFDEVILRIGTSDLQSQDVASIEVPPSNTRVIVQSPEFKSYNGFMGLGESDCDYVFFLCHDDFLQPEGTKELLEKLRNSRENIACIGSLAWTGDDLLRKHSINIALPENGIDPVTFFLMDAIFPFPFNLSGIAVPRISALNGTNRQVSLLHFGIGQRADSMFFISTEIQKIFHTKKVCVLINQHSGQLGRVRIKRIIEASNTSYFLNAALVFKNQDACRYSAQKILYFFRLSPGGTILGFAKVIKVLYQEGFSFEDLRIILRVVVLMVIESFRKAIKKILNRKPTFFPT